MCTQGPVCKGRGGLFLHGLSVQVLTRPFRCMHSTQSTASMSTIGGLPSRQSFYVPIDTHQGSGLPQFWSHTLMSMLHSIDHLRTGVGVSEHSCGVHPPHLGITGSHATSAGSRGVRERWRCAVARARAAHDALGDRRHHGSRLQAGGLIQSMLPLLCLHIRVPRLKTSMIYTA